MALTEHQKRLIEQEKRRQALSFRARPLVAQTLHLYTYEDGEWPGIPGCRGAHLLRTMELANKIAELAGWNVRFKPVRVLWRKAWEKSFLRKKD